MRAKRAPRILSLFSGYGGGYYGCNAMPIPMASKRCNRCGRELNPGESTCKTCRGAFKKRR